MKIILVVAHTHADGGKRLVCVFLSDSEAELHILTQRRLRNGFNSKGKSKKLRITQEQISSSSEGKKVEGESVCGGG